MSEVSALSQSDELKKLVVEAFADGGALSRAMPAFEPRSSQREMAIATSDIFDGGGVLLAEAGTGTGKTLAYLVPAILSRERVLVSTGTKNLQDQIYEKDLPALRDALDVSFTATYMKGRGNYLCLHRFDSLRQSDEPRSAVDLAYVETISQWAGQTETGDSSEIEDLPDNLSLWKDISASSENCIGTDCPLYDECFVTRMRRRALESDIVIVNHHLLCADASVRQNAYGEVIPACGYAIIDEAHQLEDVATQYFGVTVSNYRLDEIARDVHRVVGVDSTLDVRSADELHRLADRTAESARGFFGAVLSLAPGTGRHRIAASTLERMPETEGFLATLAELAGALEQVPKTSEDVAALARRAGELQAQLTLLVAASDPAFVYFVERRANGVFLRASPIDVSAIVRETILQRHQGTILTSATLTVDTSFDYIKQRLGLNDSLDIRLASEFDYKTQTVLYLPRRMPDPRDERFPSAFARELTQLLAATQGRAFVLFTSYANLRAVHALVADRLEFPLLVQGNAPRSVLLREFRTTPNSVLLATASFWQGVDVIGDTLSCVVIDKLPFASPGDPITAARMETTAARGGDPFQEYQVPLAILSLLQGLGRLIRHRNDRGVLALFDPRIRTKGYGRRFLESLPPAPVTHDVADVHRFMQRDSGNS